METRSQTPRSPAVINPTTPITGTLFHLVYKTSKTKYL